MSAPDYRVSQRARQDLGAAYGQFASDPATASQWVCDMLDTFSNLVMLPHIGKPWIGNAGVTVFRHQNHLIFYSADAACDDIRIERVVPLPQKGKGFLR
jgi:plasmid stabilization system protein ParE